MNEVIHLAANVDFSAYTYNIVYAATAQTPTINGEAVAMIAGGTIPILVKSITGTTDVYCIGKKILLSPINIRG